MFTIEYQSFSDPLISSHVRGATEYMVKIMVTINDKELNDLLGKFSAKLSNAMGHVGCTSQVDVTTAAAIEQ